jgi:hypothetical protein
MTRPAQSRANIGFVAQAADTFKDPVLLDEAETLMRAAASEVEERRRGLAEPETRRAVERDVERQLVQLALRARACAARWQANAFEAQADAIENQRQHRRSRQAARERAEEVERRIEELADDPARDLHRNFLISCRDIYRGLADDKIEWAFDAIDSKRVAVNRSIASGTRNAERRLRRRRNALRLARVTRLILRFVVSFGVLAYGVDQLIDGVPIRGLLAVVVAVAVWLVLQRIEPWASRRQDETYVRWLSGFLDRVGSIIWMTEFELLLDARMRQGESGIEENDDVEMRPGFGAN